MRLATRMNRVDGVNEWWSDAFPNAPHRGWTEPSRHLRPSARTSATSAFRTGCELGSWLRLCRSALWCSFMAFALVSGAERPVAELVEVRKIWDVAPHNAFTDLIRFRDRWFCVFREGKAHVSPDGALRVIISSDGVNWESA